MRLQWFPTTNAVVRLNLAVLVTPQLRSSKTAEMSNDVSSFITSSSQKPAWSWKIQNISTPQTYAAKNLAESKAQSSSSSGVAYSQPNHAASIIAVPNGHAVTVAKATSTQQKERKRRKLDRAEMGLKNMIAEQYVRIVNGTSVVLLILLEL